MNLSDRVDAVTYKSRLYTKMHLWSGFSAQVFRDWAITDQIRETCTRENRSADVFLYKRDLYTSRAGQTSLYTNKNAPHVCEAFGAENETRTISCNILTINGLKEFEKTLGETFVAFQDVWGKRHVRPSLTIKTTSADFKHQYFIRIAAEVTTAES